MTAAALCILLLLAIAVPEREIALGLWRRWLGSHGGHRWVKVSVLVIHETLWWHWAIMPVIPVDLWASPWQTWPLSTLVALALLPVYVAGVCLWFVWGHNNGGEAGTGGPERYGWAGYGYLWSYPFAALIPEIKLGGWSLVKPGAWTSVGEICLGRVTGRITALGLAAVFIVLAWATA